MKKKKLLMAAIAIFGLATITIAQVPSYVPTNGLVGWWPFNGNAYDESVNGNNGAVNGATLTTDRFGNTNKAFNFNGVNQNIEVANSNSLNPIEISISVWIYPLSNDVCIISKNDPSNATAKSFRLSHQDFWQSQHGLSTRYGSVGCNVQNEAGFYGSQGSISNNTWSHIVTTVSATGMVNHYLNGIFLESNQSVPMVPCNNALSTMRIGGLYWNGEPNWFNGIIDDIGIWNRALTACEIKDLYNAQLNSSASIQAGTDVSICEGNDVIFNGSGGSNYTWNNGVQNGVAYIPTISQEYIVIGQDTNNCYGTDTIYVELMPNTAATQTQTALDSYTWPINSQTYTQSGTYTAVIPNAAGCDSTITLELSLDFTGLEDNSQGALFSVFPNPAQSAINIKADISIIGEFYTIYDNAGRVVLNGKINSENATIELGNLTRGIYMFSVGENMKQTFKVIKE